MAQTIGFIGAGNMGEAIIGAITRSRLYTPENVYAYCTRLIRKLGPEGFILQSGCDIPANAKLENVKAMVAAAVEG